MASSRHFQRPSDLADQNLKSGFAHNQALKGPRPGNAHEVFSTLHLSIRMGLAMPVLDPSETLCYAHLKQLESWNWTARKNMDMTMVCAAYTF